MIIGDIQFRKDVEGVKDRGWIDGVQHEDAFTHQTNSWLIRARRYLPWIYFRKERMSLIKIRGEIPEYD